MSAPLTPRQRAQLKARAHALSPILHIGKVGLEDAVVAEVDSALKAHELIKVKINEADRDAREEIGESVAARTDSAVVQRVGKILVLWRPRPDDEAR